MTAVAPEIITLRAPRPSDIEALGLICYEAFGAINAQHNFPNDMPSVEAATGLMGMVQSVPGIEGIVAEREGKPVGSAYLWPDGTVGGIGPVTVAPGVQNEGVGKGMMRWIVGRSDDLGLQGQRLVQAAFHGRSMALYTKLDFEVKEPLAVMQGTLRHSAQRAVRPLTEANLNAANALCERIHGHTRAGELMGATMRGEARGCFDGNRLTGYATTVGFFGHAIGETNEDLLVLIASAESISGPGILVPTRNSGLFQALLEGGMRIQYPATLMARGFYREPTGAFLPSILY